MFKKGSQYTRKDVGWILLPETGRPNGGNWDTGYVVIDDQLIIFMNIGVPGKTDHDFDNDCATQLMMSSFPDKRG